MKLEVLLFERRFQHEGDDYEQERSKCVVLGSKSPLSALAIE